MNVKITVLRSWAKRAPVIAPEIEKVIAPKPVTLVPGRPVQATLWVGVKPWRRMPRWKCPGCEGPTFQRRRYCRRCQKRLEVGNPTDLDDYLTDSEYRKLAKRMPGTFVVGGRPRL